MSHGGVRRGGGRWRGGRLVRSDDVGAVPTAGGGRRCRRTAQRPGGAPARLLVPRRDGPGRAAVHGQARGRRLRRGGTGGARGGGRPPPPGGGCPGAGRGGGGGGGRGGGGARGVAG